MHCASLSMRIILQLQRGRLFSLVVWNEIISVCICRPNSFSGGFDNSTRLKRCLSRNSLQSPQAKWSFEALPLLLFCDETRPVIPFLGVFFARYGYTRIYTKDNSSTYTFSRSSNLRLLHWKNKTQADKRLKVLVRFPPSFCYKKKNFWRLFKFRTVCTTRKNHLELRAYRTKTSTATPSFHSLFIICSFWMSRNVWHLCQVWKKSGQYIIF